MSIFFLVLLGFGLCLVALAFVFQWNSAEHKDLRAEKRERRRQADDAERIRRLEAIAARVKARSLEDSRKHEHNQG